MVHLLINHPTFNSINEKDKDYERTALHYGEFSTIFKLITLSILLFKASSGGYEKVVHLLINHPTFNSLNEKDKYFERTALHYGEYLNIF